MILVAGASGFVGQALLARLAAPPVRPLRAFVRREFDAVRLRDRGIDAAVGDLVDGRGLDAAMRGVRTLVYLVHTVERGGDVVANDLEAARNVTLAARAAGVERVIFLGHVAASDEAKARYLVARWAVERAMQQSGMRCTVLRAPVIAARGAQPFELATMVASRLPVAPLFATRRTLVEPVSLPDVVEALTMAIDDAQLADRSFDICGAERVSLGDMVKGWTRALGKRRIYLPAPGKGEPVAAYAAWALRVASRRRGRLLLETFREQQVCADPSRRFPLPHRPATYRQTLAALAAAS